MAVKNLVQSVQRALSILELLDKKGELGVTEISEALDLDKSTAFRLISTLKNENYLVQNAENSKYYNGFKLYELGQNVFSQTDLIPRVQPYLKEIAQRTGETVNLAIREGASAVFVEKIESEDIIKVGLNIGLRRPLYCTAVGKVIMAYLDKATVDELVTQFDFVPYTPHTLTTAAGLRSELERIRQQGFAEDNEEHFLNIHCVGAPLLNYRQEPVGAVSVSVPVYKLKSEPNKLKESLEPLLELTRHFSTHVLGMRAG